MFANIYILQDDVHSQTNSLAMIDNSSQELRKNSQNNACLIEQTSVITHQLDELSDRIIQEISNKRF